MDKKFVSIFVVGLIVLVLSIVAYDRFGRSQDPTAGPAASGRVNESQIPQTPDAPTTEDQNSQPAAPRELVYSPSPAVADRSRPLKERLSELTKLAETDVSTAYDLATSIGSCTDMTQSDERVEALVDQGGRAVGVAEAVLDMQDYCAGLTKSDFDDALALLDSAASSGLQEAQENYVLTAGVILFSDEYRFDADRIAAYKRKAISHLNAAARNGSADALANLSYVYEEGRITPRNPRMAAEYYEAYLARSGRSGPQYQARLEQLRTLAEGDE